MSNTNIVTVETVEAIVNRCEKSIVNSFPAGWSLSSRKYLRWIVTEFKNSPALYGCTIQSFCSCIVQAAQLGLAFGKLLGQVYIVPFKNSRENVVECQLIIGYKGLLELTRRSGELKGIDVKAVHAGDEFFYEFGLMPQLKHIPKGGSEITHVYAIAYLKNGFNKIEVMTRREIDNIKQKVAGGKGSAFTPWNAYYEEMAKKTVLRKLLKTTPTSSAIITSAVTLDELSEAGQAQPQLVDVKTIDNEERLKFVKFIKELIGIMPASKKEANNVTLQNSLSCEHTETKETQEEVAVKTKLADSLRASVA
jgi:recombination protein RecT